jgi:sugar lactone lactonase YvrE
MRFLFLSALFLSAACATLPAVQTRTWTESDPSDFQKGVLHNLSLRSDGLLTLAPHSRELFDASSSYLWAIAEDSKGNLYSGGGVGAKLFRIAPDGKAKMLAELDALEIHAIAVDSKDRVYAATSPDGKVYRISAAGKPEVFYDPKAKYIWALAFDHNDNLFVATGDPGEIHRVPPDGKGKVFFKTDETHVRSLAMDANANLIAGTDPGGLVLRVGPAGDGFVLYQMSKKEVTSVAVATDGSIYASGVGTKQARSAPQPIAPAAPAAVSPSVMTEPGAPVQGPARPAAPPSPSVSTAANVVGGSDVYRIDANGYPRRVWTNSQDVVYAIVIDGAGRVMLGAGNKGNIYRLDSPPLYTSLLTVPASQVTSLARGREGRIFAATGNVGKVYEIGPGLESEGWLESDVFDSGGYSLWGRLSFEGRPSGGRIAIAARSGNLDQPQKNWSAWSSSVDAPKGARIMAPPARFAQWKATLTADSSGAPALESVSLAYLPRNGEPHIDQIELTPPNYKFPPAAVILPASAPTISLPPLGRSGSGASALSLEIPAASSMQYAKGYVGVRWAAADPNGDSLIYSIEIRGVNETEWKLLKDKLAEKYFSWDSTSFPDGEYRLRITASDAPSNPPGEALSARMESDPFWIDNTPPKITNLTASRTGAKLEIRWHAADALNNIKKAEYSLDGGDWTVVAPTGKLSDSPELDYDLSIEAGPGEHTVALRVEDDYDNQASDKVVVQP